MKNDREKLLEQALAELRKVRAENERLKAENDRFRNENTDLGAQVSFSSTRLKEKEGMISDLKAESARKDVLIAEQKAEVMCTQLFGPTLSISYQRVDGMERA